MWSRGREVRVGTTRERMSTRTASGLVQTQPASSRAARGHGLSLPSSPGWVTTRPGGARSSVTPSPVTDVLWTCLTGLWIPGSVTVPAPPRPVTYGSQIGTAILLIGLKTCRTFGPVQYVNCELSDVQAGFRKGRGTRDQIANIRCIIEKAREFQKKHLFLIY